MKERPDLLPAHVLERLVELRARALEVEPSRGPVRIPGWNNRPWIEYGQAEVAAPKRRALCRACGGTIPKGERAIRFPWDFAGSGSWTSFTIYVHLPHCEPRRGYNDPS